MLTDMGVTWDAPDGQRKYPTNWPSGIVVSGDPCAYTTEDWRTRVRNEKHVKNKSPLQAYKVPNDETLLSFNAKASNRHSFTITEREMYQVGPCYTFLSRLDSESSHITQSPAVKISTPRIFYVISWRIKTYSLISIKARIKCTARQTS